MVDAYLESLKREFLELLDKDLEFRYAVAGYLGLSEILKRLDGIEEGQRRIWEEIKTLREEQAKIWEEIRALRKEQVGLREEQVRLREEQVRLREEQTKIWGEIAKVWVEIRSLREGQNRLERRVDSLERAMVSGFGELSKFAGLTFEEFIRKFLTEKMRGAREIPEDAELVKAVINGEEINIFLEEPLIVGEATSYADSAEEIAKLLRKAEAARARYSKEPRKILVILAAKRDAAKEIIKISEEKEVEAIIGKIID